jgi:hypothetical protein
VEKIFFLFFESLSSMFLGKVVGVSRDGCHCYFGCILMYHCFRMQCGTIIVFEGYLSSNEYTDGTGMTH